MRVFLVDEQKLFTEALSARLSGVHGLLVMGRGAATDPGLADAVIRARPHVITLDIRQAGTAAGELLDLLGIVAPDARVVVLTSSRDASQVALAARRGAVGWLDKDCSTEHLIEVLRGVGAGRAYFAPDLLGVVLDRLRADLRLDHLSGSPLEALSSRERDVLLGMVEGKRGTQIAAELFLSVNTVRTHTHNLFTKLNVHSRVEAASLARAAGVRPRSAGTFERLLAEQLRRIRPAPGDGPPDHSPGNGSGPPRLSGNGAAPAPR